jgi:hypothetical protein
MFFDIASNAERLLYPSPPTPLWGIRKTTIKRLRVMPTPMLGMGVVRDDAMSGAPLGVGCRKARICGREPLGKQGENRGLTTD